MLVLIVAGVIAYLIYNWIWNYWREIPSLENAGPIRIVEGDIVIPLRTRSTIPVVVFGYWVRIRPLACAILTDEKPVIIDTDVLPHNKWIWKTIEPFQVKRDEVSKLPVRINYINNEQAISVEICLGYGDPNQPQSLPVGSYKMNAQHTTGSDEGSH